MDWITLMWITAFIIIILLCIPIFKWIIKERKKTVPDYEDVGFCISIIIVIIVCCMFINLWEYNSAVSIPYEYRADIKNIEEMELYLMRYENTSDKEFGNIGQGMESLDYKQQLQRAIQDKNEIYAGICSRLNNAWAPYKDIIISGLPPGIYGNVVVPE